MGKKILSFILMLSMLICLFSTFSISVNAGNVPSNWALKEINSAIREGLVTDKVTKDYQKNITREEFCELAVKLYQKITAETVSANNNPFIDTDNEEILKAYSLGIVKGISDTEFAPNNTITRQEMCVMLVRVIESVFGDEFILKYDFYKFDDIRDIADWAFEQIFYAYEKGIVKGIGNNKINPLGTATCEQAVIMMYRLYENIDNCKTVIPQEVIDRHENYTYVNNSFKEIEKKYTDENGYVLPENIDAVLNEVFAKSQEFIESGDIRDSQLNKEFLNVCVTLKDGVGYIYTPSAEGVLNSVQKSTEIIEFDNFPKFDVLIHSKAGNTAANKFDFCDYSYIDTNKQSIVSVKEKLLSVDPEKKCIIYWHGHGSVETCDKSKTKDPDKYEGVVLGIPEKPSIKSLSKFEGDINEHRIIYLKDVYGLTPTFFDTYLQNVKSGLFFAGACESLCDKGVLADVFFNKGFDAYIGSNMTLSTLYVNNFMNSFGEYLCEYSGSSKADTITVAEALQKSKEKHGTDWNNLTKIYNTLTNNNLSGGEFMLVGDSDFRLIESEIVQSSHIAEYNGITYSSRDVPGMVKIPVQATEYDYLWEFAFYEDKLYYSCKNSGLNGYGSAIYSCNPDGSNLKKIYVGAHDAASFTIADNKLYPSSAPSHYGRVYVDLKTDVLIEPGYVIPNNYNVFYVDSNYIYCSTYSKNSKYSIYKIDVITGKNECIKSNISEIHNYIVSSDGDVYYGNKNCLYVIKNGESKLIYKFDRNISLVAVIGDMVYYQNYQDNTAGLYCCNLSENTDIMIDSRPSSGGIMYFNG